MSYVDWAKEHAGARVRILEAELRPTGKPEHEFARLVGYSNEYQGSVVIQFDSPGGLTWERRLAKNNAVFLVEDGPDCYYFFPYQYLEIVGEAKPGAKAPKVIPDHPHTCPVPGCNSPALILATSVECTSWRCKHYRKR